MPTRTEKAVPVCFWQWVQRHTPMKTGSVFAVYLTWPQRQPPVIRMWRPLDSAVGKRKDAAVNRITRPANSQLDLTYVKAESVLLLFFTFANRNWRV